MNKLLTILCLCAASAQGLPGTVTADVEVVELPGMVDAGVDPVDLPETVTPAVETVGLPDPIAATVEEVELPDPVIATVTITVLPESIIAAVEGVQLPEPVQSNAYTVDLTAWAPYLDVLRDIYSTPDPDSSAQRTGLDGARWQLRMRLLSEGFSPAALVETKAYYQRFNHNK